MARAGAADAFSSNGASLMFPGGAIANHRSDKSERKTRRHPPDMVAFLREAEREDDPFLALDRVLIEDKTVNLAYKKVGGGNKAF